MRGYSQPIFYSGYIKMFVQGLTKWFVNEKNY